MNVTILVGNPAPKSRTRMVAEAVGARIAEAADASLGNTIDLSDYAGRLFEQEDKELVSLQEFVATSALLVVATPTYKATYTGLLKAFLDRYGTDSLEGVTAFGVMTGSSPQHALAVDTTLRSLLVELGASVPTKGLFVLTSELEQIEAIISKWAERNLGSVLPSRIQQFTPDRSRSIA